MPDSDPIRAARDEAQDPAVLPLDAASVEMEPGDHIGPYKLLQEIGEGGFGTVWMAEQREPVKRRVALKIIKLGMDTRQVIARFEAERQALALMEHPNIARVLDAGTSDAGRPYFVMELVKGVSIVEYCDTERLDTRARIELVGKVCQAVQHAHQKGIIHRDIKPSNVLVTLHDGVPVPKVIDFGIAKAMNQELTEKTLFTEFRQLVGTPAYMSPEQAERSGLDVDTRADIYSLGVLLYELLTGTTPFDIHALLESGYDAMLRAIREDEPRTPSSRISALGDTAARTAELRRTDARQLGTLLRGDLDWIVMCCLEKDRTRRYETASGLADDLRRHLAHEPVLAGPPSKFYRLGKFVRRNRRSVLVSATLFAVLVAGLVGTARGLVRERAAREAERAARVHAESVAAFIDDMLSAIDPAVARTMDTRLLRTVLDGASRRVEETRDLAPAAEAEIHWTIGRTYGAIGAYDAAEPHLEKAHAMLMSTLGSEHRDVLQVANDLASLHFDQGRYAEAKAAFEGLVESARRLYGPEHPWTLAAKANLGNTLRELERFDEAEAFLLETLEARRRLLGARARPTGHTLGLLAVTYADQDRWAEAVPLLEDALGITRELDGNDHPDTIDNLTALGVAYDKLHEYDAAESLLREAVETGERVLGREHPELALSLSALGRLYLRRGLHADAEPLTADALEIARRVLDPLHPTVRLAIHARAAMHTAARRFAEAEPLFREELALFHRVGEEDGKEALHALTHLGEMFEKANRHEDAEQAYGEALERSRRTLAPGHATTLYAMRGLAKALVAQGRSDAARPLTEERLDVLRARANGEAASAADKDACARALLICEPEDLRDPHAALALALEANEMSGYQNARFLFHLARAYDETRDPAQAVETYAKLLAIQPRYPDARMNLGIGLMRLGRLEQAVDCFRQVIEEEPRYAAVHENLGNALVQLGRLDDAIESYRRAIELDPRDGWPHYDLAIALERQGKPHEAVASYERSLAIQPRNSWACHNLALVLVQLGRSDEALERYRQALAIDPGHVAARVNLGNLQKVRGELDEAIASYEIALELEPGNALIHTNAGAALHDQGKLDEALERHRRALELDPSMAVAHSNLGNLMRSRGALEEAVKCFSRALELDPELSTARNNLEVTRKEIERSAFEAADVEEH